VNLVIQPNPASSGEGIVNVISVKAKPISSLKVSRAASPTGLIPKAALQNLIPNRFYLIVLQ
jgi:hypothetical protein